MFAETAVKLDQLRLGRVGRLVVEQVRFHSELAKADRGLGHFLFMLQQMPEMMLELWNQLVDLVDAEYFFCHFGLP
jgi:hypothetical protein